MPMTKPLASSYSSFTVMNDDMFVNSGFVGVFNATELIYAVLKANKGGLDSLYEFAFIVCHELKVRPFKLVFFPC